MDLSSLSRKIHPLIKQLDEEQSEVLANLRGSRGFTPRMSIAELLTFMVYFHFRRCKDFKAYCQYMRQHHANMFLQQLHYKSLCAWRIGLLAICKAILEEPKQGVAECECHPSTVRS